MRILSVESALKCAAIFKDYFGSFNRIDEYMRSQKLASLEDIGPSLFSPEGDLFTDFTMNPVDMKFVISEIDSDLWNSLLNITSSHINIPPVGRNIKLAVKELTTDKYVGFIRLGSPMINCKPRNVLLNSVFSQTAEGATAFNNSTIMGFVIVPAQPFGFNYLGGKLLAGMCCSHEMREIVNRKYPGMNLVMFETTSLYGSTKTVSQYDGMKPYLRHRGETDSDFIPMIHGPAFDQLKDIATAEMGKLTEDNVSSRKMKIQTIIIGATRAALKLTAEGEEFNRVIEAAKNLTEQKRYYVSNYGIKNYIDIVTGKTRDIVKDDNFDRFYLDEIVKWWTPKAVNRFTTLKEQDRLKTELEVWTSGKEIQIIR